MESIGIGDWVTIFFGVFGILSGIIFALIRNHVMLQECIKKIETLLQLFNEKNNKQVH